MKKFIFLFILSISNFTLFAQNNVGPVNGIFTYDDNNIDLKIELANTFFTGTNKDLLVGNVQYSLNGNEIINQKNVLKRKTFPLDLKNINIEVTFYYDLSSKKTLINFEKQHQIFVLSKNSANEYVLEYSELETKRRIHGMRGFEDKIPVNQIPINKMILQKTK